MIGSKGVFIHGSRFPHPHAAHRTSALPGGCRRPAACLTPGGRKVGKRRFPAQHSQPARPVRPVRRAARTAHRTGANAIPAAQTHSLALPVVCGRAYPAGRGRCGILPAAPAAGKPHRVCRRGNQFVCQRPFPASGPVGRRRSTACARRRHPPVPGAATEGT